LIGKNPLYLNFLSALPSYIYFAQDQIFAVHAAIDINLPLRSQLAKGISSDIALWGRYIRIKPGQEYEYIELGEHKEGDEFWWQKWEGPETVVFGHTPNFNGTPWLTRHALGLDTACAYLTAEMFSVNGGWSYFKVKAKKSYWQLAKKKEVIVI
jgi:hypothetical protein